MRTLVCGTILMMMMVLAGCSASTTTKELNEKSAHDLIKTKYADMHYPIAVSTVAPLLKRVPYSYESIATTLRDKQVKENVAIFVLMRLLDAKLVVETTDTVKYPNVHGAFNSKSAEYDLEIVPNTNQLKGVYSTLAGHSNVTGTLDPNGMVSLGRERFQYKEDGGTAWLMDQDRFNVTNFKGTPHGTMDVKSYTYAFSPDLKIEKTPMPTFGGFGSAEKDTLNGGSFDIGDVSDLQLGITPTMASASFAWKVSLNKIGTIFYQSDVPSGKGRAGFVKKPDDTWVINQWCISNCVF